jgi:hypothetical protein
VWLVVELYHIIIKVFLLAVRESNITKELVFTMCTCYNADSLLTAVSNEAIVLFVYCTACAHHSIARSKLRYCGQ